MNLNMYLYKDKIQRTVKYNDTNHHGRNLKYKDSNISAVENNLAGASLK